MKVLMAKLLEERPENIRQWLCQFFLNPDLETDVREAM